jgi:SAM-dependent methyltransferase
MDYVGYQGPPDLSNDDAARAFFAWIDRELHRAAWFAQANDAPLFSGLIDYASLRGRLVLEVGCGLGAISAELARHGARVTALDITCTGVTCVAKRFSLDHSRGGAVQGDISRLPFANTSFDFVWAWGVLPHTPNAATAIAEIHRVLRPGGDVALMIYNRHSVYSWLGIIARYGILRLELLYRSVADLWRRYSDGRHIGGSPFVHYYSSREVRQALQGFDVLEMRTFEQKAVLTSLLPRKLRRSVEAHTPDRLMRVLFGRLGMLLYCRALKWGRESFFEDTVPEK